MDGASRAPVRLCRTRRRRMTGDPGGSPDPLCAARGPIFRKSAGHSSCRISVPDAQYKEKTFFLSAIVPLFGRVSGCVPSCGEGQHPCPSRRFRASLGPLFRQCRDCLFPSPWTLSEGRKEQQEKTLALLWRLGGHFRPQCGQLRGRRLTLFRRERDLIDADFWKRTGKASSWGIFCDAYLGCQPFSGG